MPSKPSTLAGILRLRRHADPAYNLVQRDLATARVHGSARWQAVRVQELRDEPVAGGGARRVRPYVGGEVDLRPAGVPSTDELMKHIVPVEPRPVSLAEAAVLSAVLTVASVVPDAARRLAQISALVVVARCDCGCDTVDFQKPAAILSAHPIADGLGRTADGGFVGVIVFATDSEITSLEIYDAGGPGRGGLRLPLPESIHGWADHRLE